MWFSLCHDFNVLEIYLVTHDFQFVFKPKHCTDICIFTVKTFIKYYTDHNTPVYTCLLDASKAFDRVNHWTLFALFIDTRSGSITDSACSSILVPNATSLH